ETEEIRVNGKEKTKDELHFKETCYKNSPVYETSYLDGNQENSKLEILKEDNKKNKKPLVTFLFNYKRWNRPSRYINLLYKSDRAEITEINKLNEMSQYFFNTCLSDGKQRISFTYPPSLSIFLETIQRKMAFSTTERLSYEELYDYWIYRNEKKEKTLRRGFITRIEALGNGSLILNVLEKRTRLCNDAIKKEYFPKIYDPFLSGLYRGTIKNEISIENSQENAKFCINKIYGTLFAIDYKEFEHTFDSDRKSLLKEIRYFLNLIKKFSRKPPANLNSKRLSLFPKQGKEEKFLNFFFFFFFFFF
ncbi:hypothetical protein KN825_15420, partial [Weizmannia coagulans]|nr:hypothetical protein [Heyndrickxia coagulans]